MEHFAPVRINADEQMDPRGEPKPKACATCVQRRSCRDTEPFGEEWADEAFQSETLSAAWIGTWDTEDPRSAMRNGGLNSCHQTHVRPCSGMLVSQQRELLRWHARSPHAARGPLALSEMGIARIGTRMLNGGERWDGQSITLGLLRLVPRSRLLELAHPAISDPAIGHHELLPAQPGEFDPEPDPPAVRDVTIDLVQSLRAVRVSGARGISLCEVKRTERMTTFWIYEGGSQRVGSAVIITRRNAAELALWLQNPVYRGRGIGHEAVRLLVTIARAERHKRLRAEIKPGNEAALHLAGCHGFREVPSKRAGVTLERAL